MTPGIVSEAEKDVAEDVQSWIAAAVSFEYDRTVQDECFHLNTTTWNRVLNRWCALIGRHSTIGPEKKKGVYPQTKCAWIEDRVKNIPRPRWKAKFRMEPISRKCRLTSLRLDEISFYSLSCPDAVGLRDMHNRGKYNPRSKVLRSEADFASE